MAALNLLRGVLVGFAFVIAAGPLAAQVPQEQAAQMLLDSARRAHNDKNYSFARDRFREFLQKYGGHQGVNAAQYGLPLCLIESREKDLAGAVEQLQGLAGAQDMPAPPYVVYHLRVAPRG